MATTNINIGTIPNDKTGDTLRAGGEIVNDNFGVVQADIATVQSNLDTVESEKQDTLVSGTNIKTINGETLLGSGDIEISGGSGTVDSVNGETGIVVLTTGDIAEDTDKNYVTDAQATVIGNTSGTNTGDQDLSGLALKSNVLELDNTDSFTPTADYEPATKKYVDDNAGGGGGSGDMTKAVYDPNSVEGDAFDRANHTGTQTMSTISDAGALATLDTVDTAQIDNGAITNSKIANGSIAYANLTTPVKNSLDLADSALQSVDLTSDVTGTLPIANGGTNATTASSARTNLKVPASDNTGITGADNITNIVSLTETEYGLITPNSTTLYILTT